MDVAVLAMDGVADFGLSAVLETFSIANSVRETLAAPPPPWRVRVVSTTDSVRSGNGNTIPTMPMAESPDRSGEPRQPGVLVVPAINVLDAEVLTARVSAIENRPVLDWISRSHSRNDYVAGVCTGTFFLAEAGVLDGLPATTSWWLGPAFRKRYPAVMLNERHTLCRTAMVATAGAALSHVDLALSLVHAVSPASAELAARYLVAGNGPAQSGYIVPEVMARGNSLVAAFERWVRGHLGENFRISTAARALGTTERSLQRATQSELGMPPRDFVHDIRIEHAAYLLRTTSLSVEAIAARVGYLNGGTLRSLVRRRRDMTIAQLRVNSVWCMPLDM